MKKLFVLLLIAGGVYFFFKKNESKKKHTIAIHKEEYLDIKSDNIKMKRYPNFNSQTIAILNKYDVCVKLKRGDFERIGDTIDFWYNVKYDNKEGWIYGLHTSEKFEKRTFVVQQLPFEYKKFYADEELEYYDKKWIEIQNEGYPVRYDGVFPIGWTSNGDFCYIGIYNNFLPSEAYLEIQGVNNKSYNLNLPVKDYYSGYSGPDTTVSDHFPGYWSIKDIYKYRKNALAEAYKSVIKYNIDDIKKLLFDNNVQIYGDFELTRTIIKNGKAITTAIEVIEKKFNEKDPYSSVECNKRLNIYLLNNGKKELISKIENPGFGNDFYCYLIKSSNNDNFAVIFVNLSQGLDEFQLESKIIALNKNI